VKEKVLLIDHQNKIIPAKRQVELLEIARSTVYYQPRIVFTILPENVNAQEEKRKKRDIDY